MIKRHLSMDKNTKRLIIAVPAYLDNKQREVVRKAASDAIKESSISLPYPIALVRESLAIALNYRQ